MTSTDGSRVGDASPSSPSAVGGVAEAIRHRLGEFAPAERKVARVLLAAYPAMGFETVARIAERAGVSAPTVVRFANRLGYAGFPDFQGALRKELDRQKTVPLDLYPPAEPLGRQGSDAETLLHNTSQSLMDAVAETCQTLPPHDLQHAVDLLTDGKRRILLTGGRFTTLHARYLFLRLLHLREDTQLVAENTVERGALVAGISRRDVLVVYDFRRYEPDLLALARLTAARGGTVVLCTDIWLSPISAVADVVLPCHVGAFSSYHSLVPALAVTETVVTGVRYALGERGQARTRTIADAADSGGLA